MSDLIEIPSEVKSLLQSRYVDEAVFINNLLKKLAHGRGIDFLFEDHEFYLAEKDAKKKVLLLQDRWKKDAATMDEPNRLAVENYLEQNGVGWIVSCPQEKGKNNERK